MDVNQTRFVNNQKALFITVFCVISARVRLKSELKNATFYCINFLCTVIMYMSQILALLLYFDFLKDTPVPKFIDQSQFFFSKQNESKKLTAEKRLKKKIKVRKKEQRENKAEKKMDSKKKEKKTKKRRKKKK